jgi:hypothetical protein
MPEDLRFNFLPACLCVEDHESFLIFAGKVQVTVPHSMVEGQGLFLKTVLSSHVSPQGSSETHLDRAIQKKGQMRPDSLSDEVIQKPNEFPVLPPGNTLVNDRGIGEAIADHPLPRSESRLNDLFHVLSPVGRIEHEFRKRRKSLVFGIEQNSSHMPANRRPSWFEGHHMNDPHAVQSLPKAFCLRALPASFNPFKSDEDPWFHLYPVVQSSCELSRMSDVIIE